MFLRCQTFTCFMLGLIFVFYTTFASRVRTPSARECRAALSKFKHCTTHPDGVHDLDCFGKKASAGEQTCVWKPGKQRASNRTHTLFVTQGRVYCKQYELRKMSEVKSIPVYETSNMTARVFENGNSINCTSAVFYGVPASLLRCGPPAHVSLGRRSGKLAVNVKWTEVDAKALQSYSVRYKARDSPLWNTSHCQNGKECTVGDMNPSSVYTVQIQCVTNPNCTQCVWSEAYTVPPELTARPAIVGFNVTDSAKRKGQRLLFLTWKFPAKELYDGFYVSIGKVSGEAPRELISTSQPEIRLILSYSAYQLSISAFNNASTSPAVSEIIPQPEDKPSLGDGKLNMTVHSNTSFTIYWEDDLIQNYVCFSVEWMKKGHKAVYMSFYQNENNYRTLSPLPEPLEPYERYSITLHARPDKDTCNMKHINNSESTYGSTQFYYMEGSPVSGPPNVSSYDVMPDSVVLQWSAIPEEDIRGFLLGYIIYYTEYNQGGASTERNVTVDPTLNSYQLGNLKSGTAYEVQISGVTRAGTGVRSQERLFKTIYPGYSNFTSVITVSAVMVLLLIFGSPIIKRAKVVLWPSIPNPGNSNAMQKIETPCQLELLEPMNTLTVEEWDANSLQIIEIEDMIPASTLPSMLPLLHTSVEEESSTEVTHNWIQTDTEDGTGDSLLDETPETFSNIPQTDVQTSPFTFSSDYTTMEMFQQGMSKSVPESTSDTQTTESEPEDPGVTVGKSVMDYVRQFSTSPVLGSEDMSTIL